MFLAEFVVIIVVYILKFFVVSEVLVWKVSLPQSIKWNETSQREKVHVSTSSLIHASASSLTFGLHSYFHSSNILWAKVFAWLC